MIKSIRLENWRSHHRSELEFSKGTNVIVGISGSGKSSVMDAISFALYGTFPALASHRVSLEETIMAKPMKQDMAIVNLVFEYKGKDYSVERAVKRKGVNEGTLREMPSGKILAGPKTTDVTKKISEITEVSYDLFSRAIYSEQNQIDFFLRMTPSERKQKFDELLGLDRYEKARANAVTLQGRVERMAEDRRKMIEEQRKKLDHGQLKELEKRVSEKEKEIRENEKTLLRAEQESGEAEKELRGLVEAEKEHARLKELELKAKSRAEAAAEEIGKLRKKLDGTDAKKIKEEMEKAAEKLKGAAEEKSSLEREKRGQEKLLSALKEARGANKSLLDANAKGAANTKSIKATCPVCKRPMSEHEKGKLEKELSEEESRIRKEIAANGKEISAAEALLEKLEKRLDDVSEIKEKAQSEIGELRRIGGITLDLAEAEKRMEETEKERTKISEILAELKFDGKALARKRDEFYALREKAAKAKAEERSGKELLRELQNAAKRIGEAEEQMAAMEKRAAEDSKAAEKLAVFTSALRATQAELRNQLIQNINEAMDDIWQRIYPYGDYTTARIAVDEAGYEVMVRQLGGEWVRAEGILSGGERSSAALTLRIAVSLVLTQNLGWIILDEPTHNLDANSVKGLSETMRTHLPGIIEQVFIITHDKEMEYAASGKLYTLEREKGKDGVTKVAAN